MPLVLAPAAGLRYLKGMTTKSFSFGHRFASQEDGAGIKAEATQVKP